MLIKFKEAKTRPGEDSVLGFVELAPPNIVEVCFCVGPPNIFPACVVLAPNVLWVGCVIGPPNILVCCGCVVAAPKTLLGFEVCVVADPNMLCGCVVVVELNAFPVCPNPPNVVFVPPNTAVVPVRE